MQTTNLRKIDNEKPLALGIRGRLFFGFGAVTAIFIFAIFITLFSLTHSKQFATVVMENELPTQNVFADLSLHVNEAQLNLISFLQTNDNKYKLEWEQSWKMIEKNQANLDRLASNWNSELINQSWIQIKTFLIAYKDSQNKVLDHINDKAASTALLTTEVAPVLNKMVDVLEGSVNSAGERLNGIDDLLNDRLQNDARNIVKQMSTTQLTVTLLSAIGILLAIVIAIFTARAILRHINVFRQYSNRIASGDLRQYLTITTHDEIGELGKDLNIMTESLSIITKQITEACQTMLTTVEEIRQSVNTQSSGATEQASSINQITVSLEEIEKSSSQTMEKAKSLGEAAERTREKGEQGLEAVEQSINGMKTVRDKVQTIAETILELSHQTQQVGEITAVVNRLAQQSKMLALNASIEAAKAGDAGKGFAVVASEVKNLAEQSEQSTAQVQKILEDIRLAAEKAVMVTEEGTKGVDQGTGLVEQTGDIVRSLSEVIHETTVASQQIEAAVRQEGIGIEQITAGMNEINQVTSSFVSSVKQTTEAMNNLAKIAKGLKERVDTYKV